jgi:tetratricopeptide (TPR) repeat protein
MNIKAQQTIRFIGMIAAAAAIGCGGAQAGGSSSDSSANKSSSGGGVQEEADYYMGQAGMALSEGDDQGAMEYYLEAARVYDKTGQISVERAEAHFLAADLAYKIGNPQQAVDEYDASVQIYLRFTGNSKVKAAIALNNMGTIYKEMEKKDKARNCWEKALQIYKEAPPEFQSQTNMATIEQNLSDMAEGF